MFSAKSEQLFQSAQKYIPGGVNSPVRSFKSVGGTPLFMQSARGAYLYDEDDNRYIDYIASWGPMILGHAHPKVVEGLKQQVKKGLSYGTPTYLEVKMAKLITTISPNVELIRMVNSGTEACMSAVRLARGYTGRRKIIKFEGHYHGHADMFLKKAGSGLATLEINPLYGVPSGTLEDTLVAPFNCIASLKKLLRTYKGEIAAIIVEPVAGNMGCVLPQEGFLEGLRFLCTENNIVLIFDEVMTGFRLALGGAQAYFNINADLIAYGKVIGGGMPVGAFGGKREIMTCLAPLGEVYQAGTLSGNPLAMTAGHVTLNILKNHPDIFRHLEKKTLYLAEGIEKIARKYAIPVQINTIGSMLSLYFGKTPVIDFTSSSHTDHERFNRYFHAMLHQGIYLPPSPFESWFLNNALSENDIEYTLEATDNVFKTL